MGWREQMRAERNEGLQTEGHTSGGMRRRLDTFDWAATPLGPPSRWPQNLTLAANLILASGFPMAVRWGPDLIMIYNDAYAPLLGQKHPAAFGRPLREIWPEIWDELGPMNDAILKGQRGSFFAENHRWRIDRYGAPEDAYFTISYSPIPEPSAPNGIGGLLTTAVETTDRVRSERTLQQFSERLEAEIAERASATASGRCARTCSASPISTATSPASIRPGPRCSAGARKRSSACM
jgi:hypothetical protein